MKHNMVGKHRTRGGNEKHIRKFRRKTWREGSNWKI